MVGRGETIAVTPGTTTAEVIRGLPLDSQITLITNTVNIAMELSKRKDINVFVTGGNLRGDWFSLVGRTGIWLSVPKEPTTFDRAAPQAAVVKLRNFREPDRSSRGR